MPYSPSWTNAGPTGRVSAGTHSICLSDAEEIVDAINRRRLLTYQYEQNFSSAVFSGADVGLSLLNTATAPPFDNLLVSLHQKVLDVSGGGLGGQPPTPTSMDWLWPVSDGDEDKIIVSGLSGVSAGQVGLFSKLNGTSYWTASNLVAGQSPVRAVHFNEMRQAVEWLTRGRWKMPVYLTTGILSLLPDTPWIGGSVVNNGYDELRSVGNVVMRTLDTPARGIVNATARAGSSLTITADVNCTVEAYHCLRVIDFVSDSPTWNEYDPSASLSWAAAGGIGSGDATYIGSVTLTSGTPGSISGSTLAAAIQAIIDGSEQTFIFRRSDSGTENVGIEVDLTVEFDLDSPPN